jgi:hypothetical protein
LLLSIHHAHTYEGWITEREVTLPRRERSVPAMLERVCVRDVSSVGDREANVVTAELATECAILQVVHQVHRSLDNANRELFDLDAIELADPDLAVYGNTEDVLAHIALVSCA